MIHAVGTDILEIERIKNIMLRHPNFIRRFYTASEREYILGKNFPYSTAAAIFAAKEAVSKALGTGFIGITFVDVEVLHDSLGKPYLVLHGKAKDIFPSGRWHLSLSHDKSHAVAFCILEK